MFLIKRVFKLFNKSKPIVPIEDDYVNINKTKPKPILESSHVIQESQEKLQKIIKKIKTENKIKKYNKVKKNNKVKFSKRTVKFAKLPIKKNKSIKLYRINQPKR